MKHAAQRYWDAIGKKDAKTMAACYAPDATFQDPVFALQGADIGRMWTGLFGSAKDLDIRTEPLVVNGDTATGTLHATYTFTATGRLVRNTIRSTFTVRDGLIASQRDRFSFWKWSRMALGPTGLLLGWTPLVRGKVRRLAAKALR